MKKIVVKIDTGKPDMDEKIEEALRKKINEYMQEFFGVYLLSE